MVINRNLLCIQASFMLVLFCFNKGYGQTLKVTGSVSNTSGKSIPFSSIAFYKKDTLIKGTIADSSGNYRLSIDKGKFILKASALNAEQVKDVNLTKDTVIHIILPDSAKLLNEVTIKGVKPAIEYQIDRTVFNVQNTLFKNGLSGIQLLRQAPRLEMSTDQTIKMIGRDGVRVMINGRLLNLSESAIISKLASLRSDNILKVEIIPNPPSKFSAEGNVGYINIVLKKDETNGFQLRPFFEYTQRRYLSDKFGADINYRSPKISLSISPYYEKMRVLNSNKTLYDFDNGQNLSFDRAIDMKSKNLAGSLIFVYFPTKRLELGVISSAGKNDLSSAELANTFYTNASSVLDSTIRANAPANDKTNERGLTAYAEYKIDSLGKKITFTYNNSLNKNATAKNIGSELYYPTIDSTKFNELNNTGDIKYGINSSMLDVELPYSFAKIETGFSYTRINNNSLLQFENQNNDNTKTVSHDAFDYYEHTAGAYASIERPFNKLSAKLGLRYERSTIEGNSQSMNLKNRSSYNKLFPTVNISYVGLKDNILSLTYSKRIQRPNFFYLNPFRYYTSPYAFTSGNASLQPAFIDNVELLHIFKNSLTTIVSYSRTVNGISYVSLYQDGYNYSISQNNFTQDKLNFNVIYQKSLLRWWAINPVLELYHSKNRSTVANVGLVDQQGFGGMMIVSNTFTISKSKNIFLQGNYYQFFPSQTEFQKTKAFGFFNSNIRFLLKRALQCTISYSDIFGTNRTVYTQRYNDYLFTNSFNPHAQNVSISLSYLFGNKKVNSEYRQSKNQEKSRTYK